MTHPDPSDDDYGVPESVSPAEVLRSAMSYLLPADCTLVVLMADGARIGISYDGTLRDAEQLVKDAYDTIMDGRLSASSHERKERSRNTH